MKNYNQFLNEMQGYDKDIDLSLLPKNFKFYIEIDRNDTKKQMDDAIEDIAKYFNVKPSVEKYLTENKPYYWSFNIQRTSKYLDGNWVDRLIIFFGIITTPNWFSKTENENIISLKDFLFIGLKGIKEYFELNIVKNINKYNL